MSQKTTLLFLFLLSGFSTVTGQTPESPNAGQQKTSQGFQMAKEEILQQVDLKRSTVVDAARMISELSDLNVVATEEAGKKE
ncbi:MAG: hypothetical protein VX768_04900, partial [Planctomycetota bacterium]|nr:hypothetical protein [Planctomycetota bacterium]